LRRWVLGHVTRVNESRHMYQWVMSHIWVMSQIWMSHVTHMDEACHTWMGYVTRRCVLRHVTHMNEACHTYEWGMSHIWMRHVTHMDEACHTYEWGMSHIWMGRVTRRCVLRHVTHMNEACQISEWVMSHYWWVMSHTRNRRFKYEWDWMRHGPDWAVAFSVVSHVWKSHVTYHWFMSRVSESCHV